MLKNLVTFVTGGASGLGRATVNRFAKKGAQVVFCDLPTSNGDAVAKEIGENVRYIPANVTSESDVLAVLDEIATKYHKLDVVVNCAGIANAHQIFNFNSNAPRNLSDFEKVLTTNIIGTFNVIRLTVGLIVKNQPDEDGLRGIFINTAGTEAYNGVSGQVATAAASAAIIGMMKPLKCEFGEQGIRVVTIAPGLIKTPLTNFLPEEVTSSIVEECIAAPARVGSPDEFAHLVQAIVANPYINGTTIELAAGLRLSM